VQAMLAAGSHDVHAITLVNRKAPVMRVTDRRVRVHTVDGRATYVASTLQRSLSRPGQVSLFTADGGFDVRGATDRQEEVNPDPGRDRDGLSCLAVGGCMVVKVYDMFRDTRNVAVLCECFQSVFVYKPCTSRPANSERYLVSGTRRQPHTHQSTWHCPTRRRLSDCGT
jgi:hypothetical protein